MSITIEERVCRLEQTAITAENFSAHADEWAKARATSIVVRGVVGLPGAALRAMFGWAKSRKSAPVPAEPAPAPVTA